MSEAPLIAGNNFAVLVAAAELARRGYPPILLTDGRTLGGHFAGMHLDGHAFDLGMVMLEKLPSTDRCAALATYSSNVRNDWTRFGDLAANWIEEQISLRRVKTPECLIDSKRWPDYLIANRLDAFFNAGLAAPAVLENSDPRHARQKNISTAYDDMNYREAAYLNHGKLLHDHYIEPFVSKLFNASSAELLARYHRAAWVPLYYPHTLTEALCGRTASLPEYPFWVPNECNVGGLITRLVSRLKDDGVKFVTNSLSDIKRKEGLWVFRTDDGAERTSSQVTLGLPPERVRELIGLKPQLQPAGASVALLMARVKSNAIGKDSGCLMVVDGAYATYRLTDQDALAGRDPTWHRVVIEANPERIALLAPYESVESVLKRELVQLLGIDDPGMVLVAKCVTVRNALIIPSVTSVAFATSSHEELIEAMPGVAFTGALLGYGVTSLNDQVIQGLKITEDFFS